MGLRRRVAMTVNSFGAAPELLRQSDLVSVIPTDLAVLACIDAFFAGFADVPVQAYSGYSGALTPPSSNPGSRRYQRDALDFLMPCAYAGVMWPLSRPSSLKA